MRFRRIAAIPFTLLADVVTLGNMGGPSFTEKLFEAERREQRVREELDMLKAVAEIFKAKP